MSRQIHLRIPDEIEEPLNDTVWKLRFPSRNAFIIAVLSLFVPNFDCVEFLAFVKKHFPVESALLNKEIKNVSE